MTASRPAAPSRLAAPLLALAALATLIAGPAAAADYTAAEGSTLGFRGEAQGEPFDGRFQRFDARIRFDPAALGTSRFEVEIPLESADSQNAERDDTMKGDDFFAVGAHPLARYEASAFRDLGGGRFAADGQLTLRGSTRPVVLEFTWTAGAQPVLEGQATLDRTAFGVGGGDWADPGTIAHEVRVSTRLVLAPATP